MRASNLVAVENETTATNAKLQNNSCISCVFVGGRGGVCGK